MTIPPILEQLTIPAKLDRAIANDTAAAFLPDATQILTCAPAEELRHETTKRLLAKPNSQYRIFAYFGESFEQVAAGSSWKACLQVVQRDAAQYLSKKTEDKLAKIQITDGQDAAAVMKTVKERQAKAQAEPKAPRESKAKTARKPKGPTIRDLIVSELQKGTDSDQLAQLIQAQFPDSAAAKKPKVHIAWYRNQLKQG